MEPQQAWEGGCPSVAAVKRQGWWPRTPGPLSAVRPGLVLWLWVGSQRHRFEDKAQGLRLRPQEDETRAATSGGQEVALQGPVPVLSGARHLGNAATCQVEEGLGAARQDLSVLSVLLPEATTELFHL